MAVAEIDIDQLGRKIEIFAPLGIVNIGALAALDLGDGVDGILRCPGNEVVASVGAVHFFVLPVCLVLHPAYDLPGHLHRLQEHRREICAIPAFHRFPKAGKMLNPK